MIEEIVWCLEDKQRVSPRRWMAWLLTKLYPFYP